MPIERQRQQLLWLSLNPTLQFFLTVAISELFVQAPVSLKSVEMSVSCPLSGLFEIGSDSGWDPWIDKVHSLVATEKQAQAIFRKNTLETLVGLFPESSVMGLFMKLNGGVFRLVKQIGFCIVCNVFL